MRWLALVALVGCEARPVVDDAAGNPRRDAEDDGSEWPEGAVAPEVVEAIDVACSGDSQSAGETWMVQVSVDDPQGDWTVSTGVLTVVMPDGVERADYGMVCEYGTCSGSFRSDYDDIGCGLEGRITFRVVVTDEDGNVSAPLDVET